MITIKDIAKEAKVSVTTVSRVLNNHPYVSEEIRTNVLKIAESHNYVRNANAVKLSRGETKIIGVVVSDANHSCYNDTLKGITLSASSAGYSVLLLVSEHDSNRDKLFLEKLRQREVDGLIFVSISCDVDTISSYGKYGPIAINNRIPIEETQNAYVRRRESYEAIVEYFKQKRCEKVFLTFDRAKLRGNTFIEKKDVFNRNFTDVNLIPNLTNYKDGQKFAQDFLLGSGSVNIGIYVDQDDVAAGIINEISNTNLKPNQNLFIISEGDTVVSHLVNVPSVAYHLFELGEILFNILFVGATEDNQVSYDLNL